MSNDAISGVKKRKRGLSMRSRETITGLLFLLPWLFGICFFFLNNLIQAVRYSFNRLELLPEGGYILIPNGISHYRYALFENISFNPMLAASVVAMLVDVPLIIFFSLFMALLLNRKFKLRGITRALFFLPVIMAAPAINSALSQVSLMLMGGFKVTSPEVELASSTIDPRFIANMLLNFGMPQPIIMNVIGAIDRLYETIRASGVQILIFLAALQAIPGSLYEVAQLEGATAYESFWKITFPMVSPLILTNVVYTIVDTYARNEIITLIRDTAFASLNFGLSTAMAIISTLVTSLILLLVGYGISKYVFYQT